MTPNKKYVFQVWIITIGVLAPLILAAYGLIRDVLEHSDERKSDFIGFIIAVILYGSLYSLPTALILHLIFNFMVVKQYPAIKIKVTLLAMFFICVYLTDFFIFDRHSLVPFFYPYILGALIGSYIFKVYKA